VLFRSLMGWAVSFAYRHIVMPARRTRLAGEGQANCA
jgi:hypothetical protein